MNFKSAGRVEFYLDRIGGSPVAAVQIEDAAKLNVTAPVNGAQGKHDVCLLFRGSDEQLFDLDWWQFLGGISTGCRKGNEK